jgi:hypothetical protein
MCQINGEHLLVECRKAYLPKITELDVMRRLLMDLWRHGQAMERGRTMIIQMNFSRPLTGKHRQVFAEILNVFFAKLNAQPVDIRYLAQNEYGTFHAVNYDEATLIETEAKSGADILFYIKPPTFPVPGVPDWHPAHMHCMLQVMQSEIKKKLRSASSFGGYIFTQLLVDLKIRRSM